MLYIDIMGAVRFNTCENMALHLARMWRHVAFETVADDDGGAMCLQL
jgi:hypothetical protein